MNQKLINYLTFKANQYLRLTGADLTPEEAEIWIGSEILAKSDLVKGWVAEFLVASA